MSIIRELIEKQADKLNCRTKVSHLSDVDAIRFMQEREGSLPCFGRDKPLEPLSANNRSSEVVQNQQLSCGVIDCMWLQPCNAYRHPILSPVHIPNKSRAEIEKTIERINQFNENKDTLFSKRCVGVKASSFKNLDMVTKKMLIASPVTVVGESIEEKQVLKAYTLGNEVNYVNLSSGPQFYQVLNVLFTSNIEALITWMSKVEKFLENGNLAYFPLIEGIKYNIPNPTRGAFYQQRDIEEWYRRLWQAPPPKLELETFSTPHIGLPEGDIKLDKAKFVPLLNIDLPVIENADFDVLSKLMSDFPDELCSFRDFLHKSVEEIRDASLGSEHFYEDCSRIERGIRDQTRKLKSDLKSAKLQAAFSLTGSIVASFALAFYCFTQGTGNVLTVLGPGGIAYTLSTAIARHLENKLKIRDNPAYFLWMLGKTR